MSKRHDSIGIKQNIHYEWLRATADLMLAGADSGDIRKQIFDIAKSESRDDRSDGTIDILLTNLMKIWVSPDEDLKPLRDDSLAYLSENGSDIMAVHWGMTCAAYPFWHNTAKQVGRLFALQKQITFAQIINRMKEQYGDKQTISRCGRYVVRSLQAWGVMEVAETKGFYKMAPAIEISDNRILGLVFESMLMAIPEGRKDLLSLLKNPAYFPFQLQTVNIDRIKNERIEISRYGSNDVLLHLKN